jgi:hypothetical protein
MTDNITQLERMEYDIPALEKFVRTVFHVKRDDEVVLAWHTRGHPGYPTSFDKLCKQVGHIPKALYYGTSTVQPDAEGRLRNRQALCTRTHVLVLDDIGTKVPLDELPEGLRSPTYIIESSEGNFQFGYVLKEPIDDMGAASVLVRLLYEAGVSDSGGAMPNKLVRLPDGINGKKGNRWRVRLTHLNENTEDYWTPAELLQAAGISSTWEEVQAQGASVLRRRARSVIPWGKGAEAGASATSGLVDPVLAWLYEQKLVQQESDRWVTIQCPWHANHTSGDDAAGYLPVGRPDEWRGFNCFHAHCKEKTTKDFLLWVATEGGPEAPIYDRTMALHLGWTYDPVQDVAYSVFDNSVPRGVSVGLPALRRLYSGKVAVACMDGKVSMRQRVDVWADSPYKTLTYGIACDPSVDRPIIEHNEQNYLNRFKRKSFPELPPDREQEHVQKFMAFLTYLIPDDDEREFFLDWLAAKVRNQAFRGPAILMVTPTQGTGRTTLGHMVQTLLGEENTTSVTYDYLTSSSFNAFMLNTLVICHEVYEGRTGGAVFYRNYERLKSLIEFQPTLMAINDKFRPLATVPVYTSFLLFSNHADALPLDASDRRVYVLSNAVTPAVPEYFVTLNRWLKESDWAAGVYHWLCRREVEVDKLLKPAALNSTKTTLIHETKSQLDKCIDLCLERWQGPYISAAAMEHLLTSGGLNVATHIGIDAVRSLRAQLGHALKRIAWKAPYEKRLRIRIHGEWGEAQHGICVLKTAPEEVRLRLMRGELERNEVTEVIKRNRLRDLQVYVFDNITAEV